MPTVTGSWAPNSTTSRRMRLILDYTVGVPSAGHTSVTVSGTVKVGAYYSFYHNGATLAWSGTLLGSGSASKNVNVATNGEQVVHTFSVSVPIGASASSKSASFSLTGVGYVGASTRASVNATIALPAQVSVIPPRSMGVAKVSNTRLRLSWTGGDAHDIQVRRSTVRGAGSGSMTAWETAGTVGQARSSPAELNVIAGYRWQARARRLVNGVWSDWSGLSGLVNLFDPAPQASNVVATSQSDSRQVLTWTVAATNDRPIVDQVIQRWSHTQDAWVTVATVGATARSWVDTVGFANNRGRYRVLPRNAEGNSGWAYSNFFYTTPDAPTRVTAIRTGPAAAQLTWTTTARVATSQTIQAQTSTDGGVTWTAWSDMTGHTGISTTTTSRDITSLNPARLYRFRVVAVATNEAPNKPRFGYSDASGIIRPAAPPAAPLLLAPSGVAAASRPVDLWWRHNPVDGSDQTAYEAAYRPSGSTTWTTLVGSDTQVRAVDLADVGFYEWRVRTRGQHADWSPWSPISAFEVLDPPTVTITHPDDGGIVTSNRARITATYADATGSAPTRWRAELLDGAGESVETRTGTGWPGTATFDATLSNHADYLAIVWVTSGTGLTSDPVSAAFTTDFLPPSTPDLTADWVDGEGLVRLTVENHPGTGVTVDTAHTRLERSTDLGQTWVVLGDHLPLDVGQDDAMVPLGTVVWYRAVAVSHWDTEAASPTAEVVTHTDRLWLTGEDGTALSLLGDMAISPAHGHERVAETYYGQQHPTAHYGEGRPITVAVTGVLADGIGLGDDWTVMLSQDLYYRDPTGRAFWASITDTIGFPQDRHVKAELSFTVEAVDVTR